MWGELFSAAKEGEVEDKEVESTVGHLTSFRIAVLLLGAANVMRLSGLEWAVVE